MSASDTKAWLSSYSEWTNPTINLDGTTLNDMYEAYTSRNPDQKATWFFGRSLTIGELDAQVKSAAAGLKAFGVREGDRVALALPNCPQHVVAFYAILRIGAVVVEHNPLYTAHELKGPFENHGARVAIVWDKSADAFETLRADDDTELETIISVNMIDAMPKVMQLALKLPVPKLKESRDQLHAPAPQTIPFSLLVSEQTGSNGRDLPASDSVTKDSPAVIMYTSGTTGAPKGAVLTHENLFSNLLMGQEWVKDLGKKEERMLAALPFFHAYGMTMALTLFMQIGGELVMVPSPQIPLIMQAFKKRQPTWFTGVPLLFEKTMEAAEKEDVSLKSVRSAFCGAASMPPELTDQWESMTSGMMVEGYGLTETSPIVIGTPMNDSRKAGYIGVPFPDTLVKIVDPENPSEERPAGEEGEVLVKGPQVFKGYLNNPEATEKAFHDGWFRTGDVGVMDEDGFVRLVSRIKEVIITGGFNVYPEEVERVLMGHPDVVDVAVVGRPRSDGSEDVVAAVVLSEGAPLDPEGLQEFSRERLTRYKVPRTFYHFEELPKNMMGKLNRRLTRDEIISRIENA